MSRPHPWLLGWLPLTWAWSWIQNRASWETTCCLPPSQPPSCHAFKLTPAARTPLNLHLHHYHHSHPYHHHPQTHSHCSPSCHLNPHPHLPQIPMDLLPRPFPLVPMALHPHPHPAHLNLRPQCQIILQSTSPSPPLSTPSVPHAHCHPTVCPTPHSRPHSEGLPTPLPVPHPRPRPLGTSPQLPVLRVLIAAPLRGHSSNRPLPQPQSSGPPRDPPNLQGCLPSLSVMVKIYRCWMRILTMRTPLLRRDCRIADQTPWTTALLPIIPLIWNLRKTCVVLCSSAHLL